MSDPLDVSGSWRGIFNYPQALPPNSFEAELREAGGIVTGETREVGDGEDEGETILHAYLDGRRSGTGISFVKRYDLLRRAANPVHYDGTLSPEGDEITGRWTIAGNWSGTFLMVRSSRRAEEAVREGAETAR